MKKFLSPREAIFLWILLFLVPCFALRVSLVWLEKNEQLNAREGLQLQLLAEAKLCQQHLYFGEFLANRLQHVVQYFGFHPTPGAKARSRLQRLDKTMHQKILHAIRRATGGEPWLVLSCGPNGQSMNCYVNPEYTAGRTTTEVSSLIASGVRTLVTEYWPKSIPGRSANIASWVNTLVNPVLGYDLSLCGANAGLTPFTSVHANFGTGYFTLRNGPSVASTTSWPCQGHLLVFFHEKDVSLPVIQRSARRRASPGFARAIRWEKPGPLPRYVQGKYGLSLVSSFPEQDFLKLLLRQNRPLIQQGLQPVLVVQSLDKSSRPLVERARQTLDLVGVPILFILLMVFWRGTQINVPGTWNLSARLHVGFILCLLPAIFSVSIAAVSWQWVQRLTRQAELSHSLQTRLDILDCTLRHFHEKVAEVLGQRGDKLFGIASFPAAKVRETLLRTKGDKTLDYQGLFNHRGLIAENTFGKTLAEGLAMLFRNLLTENLIQANPNLPASIHNQKGSLIMTQTVAEQYMDLHSFGSYLANPDRVCRAPYGNVQQFFQIRFLRPDPESPPAFALLNMGFLNFLSRMIRWHFLHGYALQLPDPAYRLDLLMYRFPNLMNRTISGDAISTSPSVHDWGMLRPLAESTVTHLVTKEEQPPGADPRPLLVAKPLSQDWAVGLARAEPIPGQTADPRFFLWAMAAAMAGFLITLIGVTSWFLLRPLKAFLKATGKAATGQFDWNLEVQTRDECETMAAAFNQMADKLIERQRMSRFVSDDVLQAITDREDEAVKPGGQSLFSTVLVSDIRSFTTLSEQYPPEEMVSMLNDYFTAMEEAIRAEGGIIVQLIGDAVVAHFPPPADSSSPSSTPALQAAIAMRRALRTFNQHRQSAGLFPIRTGIGLASGTIVSAVVGSEFGRLAHTLVGSVVDRATDLETFSKHAQATGIMIDRSVQDRLGENVSVLATSDKDAYEVAAID